MSFRQSHSTIPDDIIYHICVNNRVYVGQSIHGFNRIYHHCTSPFRGQSLTFGDGTDKIYYGMREQGLYQTNIFYYTAPNYGLQEADFDGFFSQFIPANENSKKGDPSKATPSQRRDAAEILHILHEKLIGNNIVNESMGGQGPSYKYRGDAENEPIKLLTRTMKPEDAIRLINASDTSKRNLINVFNLINDSLFTDKGKTLYRKEYIPYLDFNDKVNKDYIDLTGKEFVHQILPSGIKFFIIDIIKNHNYGGKPPQDFIDVLSNFAKGRENYLKFLLTRARDSGIDLTKAEQDLIDKTGAHVFAANINFTPLATYLNELMRNIIVSLSKSHKLTEGNVSNQLKKFSGVVRLTSLFDIHRLHMHGTNTAYISNLSYNTMNEVAKRVKVGFSLLNFQYLYKQTPKIKFSTVPQQSIEGNVDGDPMTIALRPAEMYVATNDSLGYGMSSRYIDETLSHRLRVTYIEKGNNGAINVGATYLRDMFHFGRQYNAPEAHLDGYMVSNRQGDVGLAQDGDSIRIYFTNVYHDTETAQSLDNVEYY